MDLQEQVEHLEQLYGLGGDTQPDLLSQLCCTLDDIISNFIFGLSTYPLNLCEISACMAAGRGNDEKEVAVRWEKVVAFAQRRGITMNQLVVAAKPLRRLYGTSTHGSWEEKAQITPEQLRQYASSWERWNVDILLKFLEPLTAAGRPLVPLAICEDMFE